MKQKLKYDQETVDSIRYWQQQMQEPELGGMGYDNFVEEYGPLFAEQVEMMGGSLNNYTEQQGKKLDSEDNFRVAVTDNAKTNFWMGDQKNVGQSIKKGLGRGTVAALNFVIDAGREIGDVENYAKVFDFTMNKLTPGAAFATERWAEEMKAKAIARKGGFGFYGRAIATPKDADKYFEDGAEFFEIRPWLKQVMPYQGERLGALGTASEILVQELSFIGPMAFLRLAKASKHVTHFTNVADKNYGNILTGKGYLKPMTKEELAFVGPQPKGAKIKSLRSRYVSEDAARTDKQMAAALSESLGKKVSVRETKALKKLNERYGAKGGDFFEQIKTAGDRGDISWKNSLQKLAATLNPKEARKIQKLVATGTAKGRFLFKKSAGGAYKETELLASAAAISGGAWVGEKLGQDFVVLGEVSGGLFGPAILKNVGGALPDTFNTLRYHFGTGNLESKEDALLSAAFGKTRKQLDELKLTKNRNNREQLVNMAKTLPSPKVPFIYDLATKERKKLKAYRALAEQIADLPADVQAEIAARVERAEELLGENPDIYASLSAITGITVLETIEQSARAKDSVGKSITINLNPDQLKQVRRKMEAMDGLVSRLENFKYNIGAEQKTINDTNYWYQLQNRIVTEVQSHLDDMNIVNDREIKQLSLDLQRRTDDLIEEIPEAHKLSKNQIDQLDTVTDDTYWKSKGVDDLVSIDPDGQLSTFDKSLQSDLNKLKESNGAFVIPDGDGRSVVMFSAGRAKKTLAEDMKIHNDMLVDAYQNDRKAYQTLYKNITGYSDYSYKVNGMDFLEDLNSAILDNVEQMEGGVKQITGYPMKERNLVPFMAEGRMDGLRQLKDTFPNALDELLVEYQIKKGSLAEGTTVDDVKEVLDTQRTALMKQVANDIEFSDNLYEVFKTAKINPKMSLKAMVDARGKMFNIAHKHSVQSGGNGGLAAIYEGRVAIAIDKAINKIPGNKQLKEAQKVYKERYYDKWLTGLTYTMFGRALKAKDHSKLAKFDKFFTMNPVEAEQEFRRVYTDPETGLLKQEAVELLKDNIARYYMSPEGKNISGEFFNSFSDILKLERLDKDSTGKIIEGSPLYMKDDYRSYGDMESHFINERGKIIKDSKVNLDALMKMIRTSAARKHVFGNNIPLATIERLSTEQNPERFRDMIMNPSADGGYDHMAEAIVDLIQKSPSSKAEKAEALSSFKVVLWQSSKNKIVQKGTELGFDSVAKRFKTNDVVNAAALDDFIKTNDNILKKIYSEKEYDDMKNLNELVQLVAGQVSSPQLTGMPKQITIPAMMSRVYGIFRGVISPKYVLTELLYQDARFRRGKLLEEIATDPDAARIMADVVIYNGIKNRRIRSEFTKYWTGSGQRFARDWMEDPVKVDVYSENLMNDMWDDGVYQWEDD